MSFGKELILKKVKLRFSHFPLYLKQTILASVPPSSSFHSYSLRTIQLISTELFVIISVFNFDLQQIGMYKQRLMKEAIEASKRKFNEFLLMFDENDLMSWEAFVEGPKDTPYANRVFLVKISLTSEYPIAPPKMFFKTKIFHPNIHFVSGEVCLDIIKSEWSPTWTLEALCRALSFLMENPNEDSPLNCDAANLIRLKQRQAYCTIAQTYSEQHAILKEDFKKRLENYSKQD